MLKLNHLTVVERVVTGQSKLAVMICTREGQQHGGARVGKLREQSYRRCLCRHPLAHFTAG